MIRKFFKWVFKSELETLNVQIQKANDAAKTCDSYTTHIKNILSNIDVSVDVHEYDHRYSPSWAVISLQGHNTDYIKFVDLGERNIQEISSFLHQYERARSIKIDASPHTSQFMRVPRSKRYF